MRFLLLESLCTETSSPAPASLNSSYYGLHSDKASEASLPWLSPDNVLLLCCSSQASTTMATEKQHGWAERELSNWRPGESSPKGKAHTLPLRKSQNLITSLIPNAQLLQTDLWYGAKTQSCDRPFSRSSQTCIQCSMKEGWHSEFTPEKLLLQTHSSE